MSYQDLKPSLIPQNGRTSGTNNTLDREEKFSTVWQSPSTIQTTKETGKCVSEVLFFINHRKKHFHGVLQERVRNKIHNWQQRFRPLWRRRKNRSRRELDNHRKDKVTSNYSRRWECGPCFDREPSQHSLTHLFERCCARWQEKILGRITVSQIEVSRASRGLSCWLHKHSRIKGKNDKVGHRVPDFEKNHQRRNLTGQLEGHIEGTENSEICHSSSGVFNWWWRNDTHNETEEKDH